MTKRSCSDKSADYFRGLSSAGSVQAVDLLADGRRVRFARSYSENSDGGVVGRFAGKSLEESSEFRREIFGIVELRG